MSESPRVPRILDIWIADAGSSGAIPRSLLDLLDPMEEKRTKDLRQPADRRRYMISRILLRKALSCSFGGDPKAWQFIVGETGKINLAHLQNLPLIDFSISHSGRAVVIAVTSMGKVGVDVERMDSGAAEGFGDSATFDGVFTKRELRYLESRPLETRWEYAVKLWTVKESYAKLLALGFQLDFASFEALPGPWRIHHPGLTMPIHLETHELDLGPERYHLALASRPMGEAIPFASVRMLDLPMLETRSSQKDFEIAKIARGPVSVSLISR